MSKKLILVSVSGDTGSDRKVNDLQQILLRNNYLIDVYNVFSPHQINNKLIKFLLLYIKKKPGGRFFALLIADVYLFFNIKKDDNVGVLCVTYPLIGIFNRINTFCKVYTYFYYIPDMMWMKKYVSNTYWYIFRKFAFLSINSCHFILAPTSSAMIDLLTFIKIKDQKKIMRMTEYFNSDYWVNLEPQKPINITFGSKFIFAPGVLKPSKNIINNILAFDKLQPYNDIHLVLLVNKNAFLEYLKSFGVKVLESTIDKIIFMEKINDAKMKWLYQNCLFVSIPSIEEGVGLPILEGQALNAKILTSISSAMPQTSALNAIFVDPFSVNSIYNGFIKIIENKDANCSTAFDIMSEETLLFDISEIYKKI